MSTQSNGVSWRALSALLVTGVTGAAGSACSSDGSASLRIETEASPLLLVHRDDGATAWTSVPVAGKTDFELEVADRHELIIVCERTGAHRQIAVTQYARTVDDGDELLGLCPSYPFVVSATVAQPGAVAFGSALAISTATSWQLSLPARAGAFDLFLFGGAYFKLETVGARRDIAVTGDLDLGVLDFSQETMQPLVPRTFTATNARAEEEPSAIPRIVKGEVSFIVPIAGDDATALLIPEASLTSAERQLVEVSASVRPPRNEALNTDRTFIASPAQASPVTLPEPIGEPSLTHQSPRSIATWTSLPDYDQLVFSRFTSAADRSRKLHELRMSRSYAAATNLAQLVLDFQEIPGFLPEWELAAGLEPGFDFSAERGSRTEEGSTFSSASRPFLLVTPAARVDRRSLEAE
jgi:hypothetical protein